jgi:hypothetical protein
VPFPLNRHLPIFKESKAVHLWRDMMFPVRWAGVAMLGLLLTPRVSANAQVRDPSRRPATVAAASTPRAELPVKYSGPPTTEAITAGDLMTRLYIFADDSMMGREVGTMYNRMGTAYIEREVRRMGLVPAGDNGGYFQNLPLYTWGIDSSSSVSVAGSPLTLAGDYLPITREERRVDFGGVPVVYAGRTDDSTTWASDLAGRIAVVNVAAPGVIIPNLPTLRANLAMATAVLVVSLDRVRQEQRTAILRAQTLQRDGAPPAGVPTFLVSSRVADLVFGSFASAASGATGKPLAGTITMRREQAPGRNVVAILPGSDPVLKNEYVAIGSHNDHIGFTHRPVDHDSMRVYNMLARPQGEDSPRPARLTDAQSARLRTMTDSLHVLHGARLDSIANGADDDGTGTVSVLEIAESFAAANVHPKRSILFVWHAGEEKGLWGSMYYTDHPTVPRDSIVAQLNMDMVGRGAAADVTGETKAGELLHGGPGYLQLVGSRRLSTELGDLMERVNATGNYGFSFDYGMDANGHPQNIYCRSDHYEYARYGIPIVFMTTGGHSDYHQVTDEPQYIDYTHMAEIARYVKDAATTIANLDHRIAVDKPKPDPKGRCVQ